MGGWVRASLGESSIRVRDSPSHSYLGLGAKTEGAILPCFLALELRVHLWCFREEWATYGMVRKGGGA